MSLWLAGQGKEVTCLFPDTPADNLLFILSPEVKYLCFDADASAAQEAPSPGAESPEGEALSPGAESGEEKSPEDEKNP